MRLAILTTCIAVALVHPAFAAEPARVKSDDFGDEHTEDKLNRGAARPDKAVSDLTRSVADKLQTIGTGPQQVTVRNLIDEHLFSAMASANVPHSPLSGDEEFCRRAYLDLTGRIPTPEQVVAFVGDKSEGKRDRLIDQLIDSPAWVDHWAYWYGDLVRNCANRVGKPATKNFDAWFRQCLKEDRPYDAVVTEMLTGSAPNSVWMPDAAPSVFLARFHVSGELMYSDRYEDTADEIAVQSARVFLGINYQCISCHSGKGFLEKVNLDLVSRKRADLWSMAAFFGKTRVRIVPYQDRFTITDDGTGYDTNAPSSVRIARRGAEDVRPRFMLTGEVANDSKPLRPQFARMLTSHPQFARATVNLIWKQFFGLGIVDPVDSFDMARQDPTQPPPSPWTVQPTNPALLEALGKDFADHGYSLKHVMRTIARSSAYQLSSRYDGEWKDSYTPYFARHYVKMLTAEQLHDAICQATQVFGDYKREDMVYDTPLPPYRFWTEAATPEEIGGPARTFLRTFGQSNREQFDRQPGGSILQAMVLMNSPFVNDRIRAAGNSRVEQLLKSDKSNDAIVDELYLATLSRPAVADEKKLALEWLGADRKQGAEDLQWALLNKLDFVFNY